MVVATRRGEPYCVAVTNGRFALLADTQKNGVGGAGGMRPHELLESALAACVCMSIEMAAAREGVTLPDFSVEVNVERGEASTCFHVAVRGERPLPVATRDLVRAAAARSPVACTLGKAVRVEMEEAGWDA